jgi:hypothetical protein
MWAAGRTPRFPGTGTDRVLADMVWVGGMGSDEVTHWRLISAKAGSGNWWFMRLRLPGCIVCAVTDAVWESVHMTCTRWAGQPIIEC